MYAKDVVRTVSDRAVVKASGERLLRDFALAARLVNGEHSREWYGMTKEDVLTTAQYTRSRTKYAALMTAFGL